MSVVILMFGADCACAAVAPIIKMSVAALTLAAHLVFIGTSIRSFRSKHLPLTVNNN
jgi:hypothetical protein